jgi:hypothetical protein
MRSSTRSCWSISDSVVGLDAKVHCQTAACEREGRWCVGGEMNAGLECVRSGYSVGMVGLRDG